MNKYSLNFYLFGEFNKKNQMYFSVFQILFFPPLVVTIQNWNFCQRIPLDFMALRRKAELMGGSRGGSAPRGANMYTLKNYTKDRFDMYVLQQIVKQIF
jgi:hypothetical protein